MVPWLVATAAADVIVPPPDGRRYVSHAVRVEGVEQHPGFVVVAFDAGPTVSEVAAWTGSGDATRTLARGGGRGGGFSAPALRLLTADAWAAWRRDADALVAAQRAACERGEGCAHVSRFTPRLPPPAGSIDCGVAPVALVTEGPADGPDTITSVFALTEASATRCVLTERPREQRRDGALLSPAPPGNCDHVGGAGAVVVAGALLALRRSRRR